MSPADALITAARRYCEDNHSYWANRYANERSGADFPAYSYSEGDYDLFPRYNVLAAILAQVEVLVERWNFDGDYWDPLENKCTTAIPKVMRRFFVTIPLTG
jgi:hypothetical protein